MKRILLCVLFFLPFLASAQSLNISWVDAIGGSTGNEVVQSTVVDASGNVYVAGSFEGVVNFNPNGTTTNLTSVGLKDAFFARYNSSGILQWVRQLGSSQVDEVYALALAADGSSVYVAGYYNGTVNFNPGGTAANLTASGSNDIFYGKYFANGTLDWANAHGNTGNDAALAIKVDASGNVYVTGYFAGTVDFDPSNVVTNNKPSVGAEDIFLIKLTSAGALGWIDTFGSAGSDAGLSVDIDNSFAYISGYFSNTVDADPGVGTSNSTSLGGTDAFFARYAIGNGAIGWWINSGSSTDDEATSIVVSGTNFYLGGAFSGTSSFYSLSGNVSKISNGGSDIFVAKYDGSTSFPTLTWLNTMGGISNDRTNLLAIDASANVYSTGSFDDIVDFDPSGSSNTDLGSNGLTDIYVASYGSGTGAIRFAKSAGSTSDEEGTTVAVDGSGNVYVGGYFQGATSFDFNSSAGDKASFGSWDAFVAKYAQSAFAPEPTAQPTSLNVVALNNTDFTYDITAAVGGAAGYLHIYRVGTASTALPVDGIEYTIGDVLSDGSIVKWADNLVAGNSYGSLTAGTSYFVKIFSYNGSGTTINYLTTNPLSATITTTNAAALVPSLTSFTPLSGAAGSSVTITGTNFSTTAASNIVYFGATKATVTAATATQLTVTVPTGATYQPIAVTVNGLTAYSIKPFILTFTGSGTIDVNSFAAKVDVTVGATNFNNQLSVGDFDGDSKTDVAVANQLGTTVSLIRNTSTSGSIAFATFAGIATGSSPQGVNNADLDGDGKLDIVAVNNGSNSISAFRNISTSGTLTASSFATKIDFATGTAPIFCASGDLDLDGKPDLVVSNVTGSSVSMLKNQSTSGTISFATKVDLTTDAGPRGIALADIDGDGKLDLIVVSYSAATFSIFRNTTSGAAISFASPVGFAAGTGTSPQGLALGDLNADGKTDLAISNDAGATVSIFTNTSVSGSLSFSNGPVLVTGARAYNLSIGDLDGDGKPDLAVAGNSPNTVSLFRNTTSGSTISFLTKVDFATGLNPTSIGISDLDGDGKVDLVVSNSNNPTVSIFRNTSVSASAPTISNFNPTSGAIGTPVTITGTNFSTTAANNIVKFNGTTATITGTPTATSIVTSVPTGATTGFITVEVGSQTGMSSTSFTVSSATLATEPTAQPTNLVFSNQSSTGFDYVFTAASGSPTGYIVLRSSGSAVTGAPVDGTVYATGDALGNAFVRSTTAVGGTVYEARTLTPATSYHMAIFAFNGTGSSINYRQSTPLIGSTSTPADPSLDTTPPVIGANTTPTSVKTGETVKVSLTITDPESAVTSATIRYGESTSFDWTALDVPMTKIAGGNVWEFTIPAATVKDLGVEYIVTARNGAGGESDTGILGVTITVDQNGLSVPFQGAGTKEANYRIVSVPLALEAKTVNKVFGDDLGDYGDKSKWRMFRYSGGKTNELTGSSNINPGEGYWLISSANATIDSGPGKTVGRISSPFTMSVTQGFNQIGNPYVFNLLWADVKTYSFDTQDNATLGLGDLKVYTGSFGTGTILKKYEGGFVMAATAGTLVFPAEKKAAAGRVEDKPVVPVHNAIDGLDWEVNFELSNDIQTMNFSGIGMNKKASHAYDAFDDFTLPRFVDFIELNHASKELFNLSYTKDIVPSAENHTWEFFIESNADELMTMKWDNSFFGKNDKQLVLWDVSQQRGFDMRSISQYIFNKSKSGHFKVYYGDEKYVKEKTAVDQVVFHDVFPNPASDKVTISFSVPTEDRVTIQVIDLLGRKVATIADRSFKPGHHEVTWNTLDDGGNVLTNGIYIAQIKSLNSDQQKRLSINK